MFWMPLLPWRNWSELSYRQQCRPETTTRRAFAPFFWSAQNLHPYHYFMRDGRHTLWRQPTHRHPSPASYTSLLLKHGSIVIVKSKQSMLLLLGSADFIFSSLSMSLIQLWNVSYKKNLKHLKCLQQDNIAVLSSNLQPCLAGQWHKSCRLSLGSPLHSCTLVLLVFSCLLWQMGGTDVHPLSAFLLNSPVAHVEGLMMLLSVVPPLPPSHLQETVQFVMYCTGVWQVAYLIMRHHKQHLVTTLLVARQDQTYLSFMMEGTAVWRKASCFIPFTSLVGCKKL